MMYDEIKYSFTWKKEYCLPLETPLARISKFCFLNGLPWSYVMKNTRLRNEICVETETSILYDLSPHMITDKVHMPFRICPQCMKYGYQSHLHEINGMNYCFLHKDKLIHVPAEYLKASRDGSYKFMNVCVENLIHNKELFSLIQKFMDRIVAEEFLKDQYIFPYHGKSERKVCYKSTERLFQKFHLLQDDVNIHGCKCIQSIPFNDIDNENMTLKQDILVNYTKYSIQRNNFIFESMTFEESTHYIQDLLMQKSHDPYYISNDVLGWCFSKIIWDMIEKNFNGYDDWEKTVRVINSHSRKEIIADNIEKYAIVLAFQAITGATAADNAVCYNSSYWHRNSSICSFGIDVYEELGFYHEPYQLYGSCEKRKATQYTVFPILQDLFDDLTNQAYRMLKKRTIKLDTAYLSKLKANIWDVPQYAVLYYQNRTDIYRCEPD